MARKVKSKINNVIKNGDDLVYLLGVELSPSSRTTDLISLLHCIKPVMKMREIMGTMVIIHLSKQKMVS